MKRKFSKLKYCLRREKFVAFIRTPAVCLSCACIAPWKALRRRRRRRFEQQTFWKTSSCDLHPLNELQKQANLRLPLIDNDARLSHARFSHFSKVEKRISIARWKKFDVFRASIRSNFDQVLEAIFKRVFFTFRLANNEQRRRKTPKIAETTKNDTITAP